MRLAHSQVRAIAPVIIVVLVATGCATTTVEKKQRITVETDPAGAWVYVEGSEGRRAIGQSPTVIGRPYKEEHFDFSNACWLGAVPAAAAAGAGLYFFPGSSSSGTDDTGPLILSILGMVYGGLGLVGIGVGCGIGLAQDGELAAPPTPLELKVVASAPGRADQTVKVTVPGPDSKLSLILPPQSSPIAAGPSLPPALAFRPPPPASAPAGPTAPAVPAWFLASGAGKRIAVLEFRGALDQGALAALADEARSVVLFQTREKGYSVMTRESMAVMLREMGRSTTCSEGECEVETARNIGADLVITGEVVQLAGTYVVALKLHETSKGTLLGAGRAQGKDSLELLGALRPAAEGLFR